MNNSTTTIIKPLLLVVFTLLSVFAKADPPTSNNTSITCLEDVPYIFESGDFPFNDTDIGSSLQGVRILDLPTGGKLFSQGNPISIGQFIPVSEIQNGDFHYLTDLNENGNNYDAFKFTVFDGTEESLSSYEMLIHVHPVNDIPQFSISGDPPAIDEDAGAQTISGFASSITDGDPEVSQNLTFILTSISKSGSLNFSDDPEINTGNGDLTYTVSNNSFGSITYSTVLMDDGGTVNGGINQSNPEQFTITVNPLNDAPTIDPIDDPLPIDEDTNPSSVTLTGISAGAGENQIISIQAEDNNPALIRGINIVYSSPSPTGTLSYTLVTNAFGNATITVTVDDGEGGDVQEHFSVVVLPEADKPSITNAAVNQGSQTTSGLVISRNPADGTEVTHFKITDILNGSLFLSNGTSQVHNGDFITYSQGNSGLKFTPSGSANGSFQVRASTSDADDGLGGDPVSATIDVNSLPQTTGIPDINVEEDGAIAPVNLRDIFEDDEDGDFALTFEIVQNTNPSLFSASTINNGVLSLSLKDNAFGTSTMRIRCTDTGDGFIEDEFIVTVNSVNDKPVFTSTPKTSSTEDIEYIYNITVTDVENDVITLTITGKPGWLTFTDHGNGSATLTGTPAQENVGQYDISVQAKDANNGTTTQDFNLTILNLNERPWFTSTPLTTIEETIFYKYTITTQDPDLSDDLTITAKNPAALPLWLKLTDQGNGTGLLTGTPPVGAFGDYSITLVVTDGGGLSDEQSFMLHVLTKNNLPVLSNIVIKNHTEDTPYGFFVSQFKAHYTDADGDTLRNIRIETLPEHGRIETSGRILGAGDTVLYKSISTLKYIPDEDYFGFDDFQWTAFDGRHYAQNPGLISITMLPVNDPPEIRNAEPDPVLFGTGDVGIFITQLSEVIDVDGDNLEMMNITFSNYYVEDEDSLAFEVLEDVNIQGKWNDTTGVLLLSGIETPENYQKALRSVRYINAKTLTPDQTPRTLEIVVYDGEYESISTEITIEFEETFVEIDIPTGFTPNNDGANDTWNILHLDRYEDSKITIFSKNGHVLYESTGYDREWDGEYNGEVLPQGLYYYIIQINKYKKTYKGSVAILHD